MKNGAGYGQTPAERFERYLSLLTESIGHADRAEPLKLYLSGLLLPGERKSVEPMAAQLRPDKVGATHQRMHHFVAQAPWSDSSVLGAVRSYTLPILQTTGGITAWVIDDTGLPKKGNHSVGVARQYCGALGKQDNCQVAVSLSIVNERLSLPVCYELYLPETWTKDRKRCREAGVPDEVSFRTKPEIALAQIRQALSDEIPAGVVLADAGYGNSTDFRDAVSALPLLYVVGIQTTTSISLVEESALRSPPGAQAGKASREAATAKSETVRALALRMPRSRYRTVTWRQGARGPMTSRFLALRVRAAHGERARPRAEGRAAEWLLIEWPTGEKEPTKYFLSTLPDTVSLTDLVRHAKLRWRIERDYEDLKGELGLDHYEGRGWRGFHHHATLCIAAYGYLVAERGLFSPSGISLLATPQIQNAPRRDYRPRGSPDPGRAPHAQLDRDAPHAHRPASPAGA